jgi:hypothetical protein
MVLESRAVAICRDETETASFDICEVGNVSISEWQTDTALETS